MLSNIKHVFFDLDHTLWDFDKNSALTFKKLFKIHQIDVPLDDFLEIYVPLNLKLWKLYRHDKINKETLRYIRLKDTFKQLEITVSEAIIHQLSIDYIAYLSTFNHLFCNVIDVLKYLKTKYKLHIITNGFESIQNKKLQHSEIAHYFETVTHSESTGYKKPSPIIFNYALEKAKAEPVTSIMIGDSIEADIEGAIHVGMQAIWCNFKAEDTFFEGMQINELMALKNYL